MRLIGSPRSSARPHVPIGGRVARFLKKHKRKFAIAGGVLAAGGAIIGGLAGGIPRKEEKKELLNYTDHPQIDMREGHSVLLLELLKVMLLVIITWKAVEGAVAVVCMLLCIITINDVENLHKNSDLKKLAKL